jgi:hypothetical protein
VRHTARGASAILVVLAVAGASGCGSSGPHAASSSASTRQATATAPAPQANVAQATAAAGARTVAASAGSVTATMHGSVHDPRVGPLWPVSFTVTSGGQPAAAVLEYEFLLAGQVVARRSHYAFTGSFHDTIEWPSAAVGYPLTLRSVIRSGGATLNLDYPVKVQR